MDEIGNQSVQVDVDFFIVSTEYVQKVNRC